MSSGGDVRFAHTVFAVREDEKDGREPEFLNQPFKLNAVHHSSTSILFRLSIAITDTDSAHNKTILYLQITPDRIASLRHATCDTADASDERPPCLERVRQRLGAKRFVTRLQLRLHRGLHAQLIAPAGFAREQAGVKPPDSPTQQTLASITSLATASTFSLYLPHNVLPMAKVQAFIEAVRQFPNLTAAQRQSYERVVDLRRLYNGKGGIVFTPEVVHSGSPLRDGEDNRAITLDTTESQSCASTVPFDTVPRDQASPPPQYDECGKEGQQPSAAAIVDDILPEYDNTERQSNASNAAKRGLQHCGSEEIDLRTSSKRIYLQRPFTTTYTTARNANRPKEKSQSPLIDSECSGSHSRLVYLLEQQCQHIQRLQADIKELERRNKELEGWHDEIEETCCEIENRQKETDETLESLLVHTGELDDECEKLGKQVPDICDNMEDWVKDNLGDAMKEYMDKWFEENMAKTVNGYIHDKVAAQIADTKARMRKALQD
ncbi:hypothetical protein CSAL01_09160 [Colletotrichum salicis]|uniref:Uncharacterized protein n=1 Tax=Colletotrichum salicis TaxID=1209931 RepID=A0A135TCP6_9PEZI|nr:hypothetical protein CSAL01_09160 [Colletotrichum salicis]